MISAHDILECTSKHSLPTEIITLRPLEAPSLCLGATAQGIQANQYVDTTQHMPVLTLLFAQSGASISKPLYL